MIQNGAFAAFAVRKGARRNSGCGVRSNRQRENRPQLNDDLYIFQNGSSRSMWSIASTIRRCAVELTGQEFRQPFNDAEDDRR